jgi:hypothetical protein
MPTFYLNGNLVRGIQNHIGLSGTSGISAFKDELKDITSKAQSILISGPSLLARHQDRQVRVTKTPTPATKKVLRANEKQTIWGRQYRDKLVDSGSASAACL